MGNLCSSCLGSRRRESYDDGDDESRLLYDDANGMQYGSFGDQQVNGQDDPQEAQREIEALQRVVARTSDNMVDIYEIAPQDRTSGSDEAAVNYTFAGQEARMARYQNLLTKLSTHDGPTATAVAGRIDWDTNEEDEAEPQYNVAVKLEADGEPLVGTFGEAAAAMR